MDILVSCMLYPFSRCMSFEKGRLAFLAYIILKGGMTMALVRSVFLRRWGSGKWESRKAKALHLSLPIKPRPKKTTEIQTPNPKPQTRSKQPSRNNFTNQRR